MLPGFAFRRSRSGKSCATSCAFRLCRRLGPPVKYSYLPRSEEQDDLMRAIDNAYRRDLVRISTMLHSKASSPVREFAKAFRFKKEREQ